MVNINSFFFKFPDGSDNHPDCHYSLLPIYAEYSDAKKELLVVYNNFSTGNSDNTHLLKGMNAWDLGYKYAYVDKSNSLNPVRFKSKNNISNEVYEFKNFIHVDGACKVEGGCNNGSPSQPEIEFYFPKNNDGTMITIKLWKEKPKSKYLPADFTERLVILKKPKKVKNKKQ